MKRFEIDWFFLFLIIMTLGFSVENILQDRSQANIINTCIASHKTAVVDDKKLKECK